MYLYSHQVQINKGKENNNFYTQITHTNYETDNSGQ